MHDSPPFLALRNAVVVRAGRPILAIDELSFAEGEHVAILGPNGSGKSTLVGLITREVAPLWREEPPVRFRGQARPMLAEVRSALGIVSSTMQDQISVHLPVADIVAGGASGTLGLPFHVSEDEAARACEKATGVLSALGIADLAARDVMTLSTGQARRVLIARALANDPEALIFDEPCTGLDPEGMHHVRASMRALARAGVAVIVVTHYPEDVIPEVNRVILLKEGRVFADGPKAQVLTGAVLGSLFGIDVQIRNAGGYYSLVSAY